MSYGGDMPPTAPGLYHVARRLANGGNGRIVFLHPNVITRLPPGPGLGGPYGRTIYNQVTMRYSRLLTLDECLHFTIDATSDRDLATTGLVWAWWWGDAIGLDEHPAGELRHLVRRKTPPDG